MKHRTLLIIVAVMNGLAAIGNGLGLIVDEREAMHWAGFVLTGALAFIFTVMALESREK